MSMKKIFTFIAVAFMAIGANAQTWNFSDWEAGDIEETKTVDGLTVYATADKKVTIDGSKKTFNDVSYTQRLKFGGTGSGPDSSAPSRFLQFDLPAGASVSIIATHASSSGDDRTLNLATGSFENVSATANCTPGELVELTYTNEGEATTAFVYSAKSGINLYAIYVTGGSTPEPQPGELVIDPALPVTFDTWDASFLIQKTDVKAGDKFIFDIETIDVEGWEWGPQVLPKSNADWSNLGDAIAPNANGKGTFVVTKEYADVINANGGLRVQGMGCRVTAVEYVEGVDPSTLTKEEFDITQGWNTWNSAETIEYNADGTMTFNCVAWGGISKWLGGADWSQYNSLVFEFAQPTTVATQAFVQYAAEDAAGSTNATQWADAGATSVSIDLDERKNAVNQFALQGSDVSTIIIKAVYLTKNDATGVTKVQVNAVDNNAIYNLAGQKVNNTYKGIVIKNGKKIVIR